MHYIHMHIFRKKTTKNYRTFIIYVKKKRDIFNAILFFPDRLMFKIQVTFMKLNYFHFSRKFIILYFDKSQKQEKY